MAFFVIEQLPKIDNYLKFPIHRQELQFGLFY